MSEITIKDFFKYFLNSQCLNDDLVKLIEQGNKLKKGFGHQKVQDFHKKLQKIIKEKDSILSTDIIRELEELEKDISLKTKKSNINAKQGLDAANMEKFKKLFEFLKLLDDTIQNNKTNSFKFFKKEELEKFFEQLKNSDKKTKQYFLEQLKDQPELTKIISKNPNLTKYFVDCFMTNDIFKINNPLVDDLSYVSVFSEIIKDNQELAFAFLTHDHFNKADYLNHNTAANIFPENLLITALNSDNLQENNKLSISNKLDTHGVLRFSILKKYQELKNKGELSENEQKLLNNIESIFIQYEKDHEGKDVTLTQLAIYKAQGKKIDNLPKNGIKISETNMYEAIDLIHLGLITNEDIDISSGNLKEMLDKVWIKNNKKFDRITLNKNFGNFIAANFKNIQNDKTLIDDLLLNNSLFASSIFYNSNIVKNYLDFKEEVIESMNINDKKYYKKLLKIEKICFDIDNASLEDIKTLKDFIDKIDRINSKKEDELSPKDKALKNFLDSHKDSKIFYSKREICKISELKQNILPKLGIKIEKNKQIYEIGLIFAENKKEKTFSYQEFLNFDDNNEKTKALKEFLKKNREIIGINDDNDKITFVKKSGGGSSGVTIKNSNGELFFVKIEERKPTKAASLLLGEKFAPKVYAENIEFNSQKKTIMMMKGTGEQDLEDTKWQINNNGNIIEKDKHFLNKIKNNKEFKRNFAESFCELYVKGYANNIIDIRRDNIRVEKNGSLKLIDIEYTNAAANNFDQNLSYIYNTDLDGKDFVKDMFDHVFFQNQLAGIGAHYQPFNDGTKEIFEFVLETVGKEEMEKILIDKIANCGKEIEENYNKALEDEVFKKGSPEETEFKEMYEKSQKKYKELLSNIKKHYPEIGKKIDEIQQGKGQLKKPTQQAEQNTTIQKPKTGFVEERDKKTGLTTESPFKQIRNPQDVGSSVNNIPAPQVPVSSNEPNKVDAIEL